MKGTKIMNLIIIKKNTSRELADQLKQTKSIEEIASLLRFYRDKTVYLKIIDYLVQDIIELEKKLKDKNKKEIEIL